MNCYVILDNLPIRYQSQENLYNISLVLSPEKQVIYNYSKSNLFPLMNEAKIFFAGSFNNVSIKNSFPKRVYSEIVFLAIRWPSLRTEIFKKFFDNFKLFLKTK